MGSDRKGARDEVANDDPLRSVGDRSTCRTSSAPAASSVTQPPANRHGYRLGSGSWPLSPSDSLIPVLATVPNTPYPALALAFADRRHDCEQRDGLLLCYRRSQRRSRRSDRSLASRHRPPPPRQHQSLDRASNTPGIRRWCPSSMRRRRPEATTFLAADAAADARSGPSPLSYARQAEGEGLSSLPTFCPHSSRSAVIQAQPWWPRRPHFPGVARR